MLGPGPNGFQAQAALPGGDSQDDLATEPIRSVPKPGQVWSAIQEQPDSPSRILTKTRLFMVPYLHERNALMLDSIQAELARNWNHRHPPLLLFPYETLLLDLLLSRYQRALDSAWMIPGWEGMMLGKVPPEEDAFRDTLAGVFHSRYPLICAAIRDADLPQGDRDWLLTWVDVHHLRYEGLYGDTVGRRLYEFSQKHPGHRMAKYFYSETPVVGRYSSFAAGIDLLLGYGFPGGELGRNFGRGFSGIMAAHVLYGPIFMRGEIAPTGSNVYETFDQREGSKGYWRKGSSTEWLFASLAAGYEWAPHANWGAQVMGGMTFVKIEQDTVPKAVVEKNPEASSGSELRSAYRPMLGAHLLYRWSNISKPKRPAELMNFNAAWNLGIRYYLSPLGQHGPAFEGDYVALYFGISFWRRALR